MFRTSHIIFSTAYRNVKRMAASFKQFSEQKIRLVDAELDINYVRAGNGPKAVLLIPGACGSAWTHFRPQIESLPELLPNHTIIAFDPPGFGRSIPPNRKFSVDFPRKDADCAHSLMKTLSIDKYSVLGWSNGGFSAMITAAKYPQHVEKLVVWGSYAYISEQQVKDLVGKRHILDEFWPR